MDEIKPAADSLKAMIDELQVVEYDFGNKFDYDAFFSENSNAEFLNRLTSSLKLFYENLRLANIKAGAIAQINLDRQIASTFHLNIGVRVANPILEMHNLSLKAPIEIIQETVTSLLSVVDIVMGKYGNNCSIRLTYSQLIALFDLNRRSSRLVEITHHNGWSNHSSGWKKHIIDINSLRCGEALQELNMFLDPTLSFLIQISDYIKETQHRQNVDPDEERGYLLEKAEQSLDFVLLALERIQSAREEAKTGDLQAAIDLLSDDLLSLLDQESEEGEIERSEEEQVVVPVHLRVLLLSERAKYFIESSEIFSALDDISDVLDFDNLNGQAYAYRSQITMATLEIDDPTFSSMLLPRSEDSEECLMNLIPQKSPSSVLSVLRVDKTDIRLHEAAEDALMAFLLGGSSDLAMAAAAEEAAKETCRKFAKSAFQMKDAAKMKLMHQNTQTPPRLWLMQSYFSGYQMLSEAFRLYGETTVANRTVAVDDEIDESTAEEREVRNLPPPDHLLDGDCVHSLDRRAYSFLLKAVDKLEQSLFTVITRPPKSDSVNDGIEDSESKEEEPSYCQIPFVHEHSTFCDEIVEFLPGAEGHSVPELLPHLKDQSRWTRVTCGLCEPINSSSVEAKASTANLHDGKELPTLTEEARQSLVYCYNEILEHFRGSDELTGVSFAVNGHIEMFHFDITPFPYPESKTASNKKEQKVPGHSRGNYFGAENPMEDFIHEFTNNYEKMFAHGEPDFESAQEEPMNAEDDDSGEWEDIDNEDEEDEEDGITTKERKNVPRREINVDVEGTPLTEQNLHTLVDSDLTGQYEQMSLSNVEEKKSSEDVNTRNILGSTSSQLDEQSSEASSSKYFDVVAPPITSIPLENNVVQSLEHTVPIDDTESPDVLKETKGILISKKIRSRILNICGSIAYLSGDASGALKCFEHSLLLDGSLIDSQIKLASLLIDMDETDKAEALLLELLNMSYVSRDNPFVLLHLGELEINRNDFQKANEYLTRATNVMNSSTVVEDWMMSFTQNNHYLHPTQSTETYRMRVDQTKEWIHCNVLALHGVAYFRINPTRPEVISCLLLTILLILC